MALTGRDGPELISLRVHLEPIFAASYTRKVLGGDEKPKTFALTDFAVDLWRRTTGATTEVPVGFVTAAELPVKAHLAMQAALQPFVDNSISKIINVPEGCAYSEFRQIYDLAYDMGLKLGYHVEIRPAA